MLPDHLFACSDGHLYDTRIKDWNMREPLRRDYQRFFTAIDTVSQLKAVLRGGPRAWPGGHAIMFVADGGSLCMACVRAQFRLVADSVRNKNNDGWQVTDAFVVDEFDVCSHCERKFGNVEEQAENEKHARDCDRREFGNARGKSLIDFVFGTYEDEDD